MVVLLEAVGGLHHVAVAVDVVRGVHFVFVAGGGFFQERIQTLSELGDGLFVQINDVLKKVKFIILTSKNEFSATSILLSISKLKIFLSKMGIIAPFDRSKRGFSSLF